MLINGLAANKKLVHFLEKYGNTSPKMQVLLFWGRHPRAKFTLDCIADALDARRLNLKEAVEILVNEGVIEEQQDHNGVKWYSVSQQGRDYLEALTNLEWSEIRYWSNSCSQRLVATCAC